MMILGAAMVIAACALMIFNDTQENAAASASNSRLTGLREAIRQEAASTAVPTPAASSGAETAAEPTPGPTAEPAPLVTPVPEMPTMVIDGEEYIGYLEIPTLGLNLPVMSSWDYDKLKTAPCRYWGSAYDDTLVILAHNYRRHFSRLYALQIGAPVQFVDVNGRIHRYVVAAQEVLKPGDVLEMVSSDYDLTLFTCTYGGATRVTVRLTRVNNF